MKGDITMNEQEHKLSTPSLVPFGEMKMTWLPMKPHGKKKYNAFVMLVKKEGTFDQKYGYSSTDDIIKQCNPMVALTFKNNEAIDALIDMLKCYKQCYFGKTDKQLCSPKAFSCNKEDCKNEHKK